MSRSARRPRDRQIAVGTGRYGQIVTMSARGFLSPTLIFGRNRSGKTAFARSMVAQAATGGVILIDFKGDDEQPAYWARWAQARGRVFKHFQLAPMSGADYRPPIEGVADRPCCYDPLRHGNADSKTTMLQNSVAREGDAAVYFRAAREFSVIAYQVAARTGFDKDKSGFETLRQLCEVTKLVEVAHWRDPATGQPYLSDREPDARKLLERVRRMEESFKADAVLRAGIQNTALLLSEFQNGPAAGPFLRPGEDPLHDIDLVESIINGDVVVFTLPVQAYKDVAKTIGMLIVNDLNNSVDTLRHLMEDEGVSWEPPFLIIEEFGSAGSTNILDLLNKSGDVNLRLVLSTQSWSNLVTAGNDSGVFAREVLSEAGNLFCFALNDNENTTVLAEVTDTVTRKRPRDEREFSAGLFGMGVRSANLGRIQTTDDDGSQMSPADPKRLGRTGVRWLERMGDRVWKRPPRERYFDFLWVALNDGKRVTHTHLPYANNWVEPLQSVLVNPDSLPPGELPLDLDRPRFALRGVDLSTILIEGGSIPLAELKEEVPDPNQPQVRPAADLGSAPAVSAQETATSTPGSPPPGWTPPKWEWNAEEAPRAEEPGGDPWAEETLQAPRLPRRPPLPKPEFKKAPPAAGRPPRLGTPVAAVKGAADERQEFPTDPVALPQSEEPEGIPSGEDDPFAWK